MKSSQSIKISKNQISIIVIVSIIIILAVTVAISQNSKLSKSNNEKHSQGSKSHASATIDPKANNLGLSPSTATSSGISSTSTTQKSLEYMIEEEKLAHDVYQVMYDKWGARVFGNILNSETRHQSQVLTLLTARELSDPRDSTLGVFKNQDLQALYDKLIAQGNQSITEAYKVGVIIEKQDIADLQKDIATLDQKDSDVKTTYVSLVRASEKHLSAFNRQLTR